jgi:hypothetical protein
MYSHICRLIEWRLDYCSVPTYLFAAWSTGNTGVKTILVITIFVCLDYFEKLLRFTSEHCPLVKNRIKSETLQIGGVSNLRQHNAVMSNAGLGPKNDCAGEDQQQL